MPKIQRITKFIQSDIATGRQAVNAVFIFERGPAKVRIKIQSDSCDFQSFARVELFSPTDMKWAVVGHIPYAEMKTPHKLAYIRNGAVMSNFQQDFDKLLGIADGLLGFKPAAGSTPGVVLVFAEVPEGQPVESGLFGPKFYKNKREALQRFAEYFVLRIRENENLRESLANCLCIDGGYDYAEVIAKLPDAELLKMVAASEEDHLQSLCEDYVSHQVLIGNQAFYCIEEVPDSLD